MKTYPTGRYEAVNIYELEELRSAAAQRDAARAVLAERERELLELKGPCHTGGCRLHYAHAGPCDIKPESRIGDQVKFDQFVERAADDR